MYALPPGELSPPTSIEAQIAKRQGLVSLYTGRTFDDLRQADIEHIVALSEAHDSGLCAADTATRHRFALDLDNLTLASPQLNRHEKRGRDAAEWLPQLNRCWFVHTIITIKRRYGLTVDRKERDALASVLGRCQGG